MKDNKKSIGNTLRSFAVFALVYLIYRFVFLTPNTTPSSHVNNLVYNSQMNEEMVNVELMKVADSINKLIPLRVDSLTEYTGVQLFPNKVFKLNVKIKIDSGNYDIQKLKKAIDKAWFQEVIMGKNLKVLRDNNVSIIYEFSDMNNHSMFTLNYSPDRYNKADSTLLH